MTLRNGFPAVSDAADQFDIRAALRATTAQDANGNIKTGVSITAKSLTGLVTAGNGMNSDIAAFDAVTNRYGPVWLSNDGTISVKHAAAPSANSRIDLICIKQNETASPASDPTDGPEAIIVTGTPAVDPVTPATPEGALALARVTIPSTATSMTSTGVIYEQMYPFTASAGADLLFRSETEKDAWTPWEGQKCRLLDGNEYQAKSGVWVSLTQSGTSNPFALLGKVRWWRQDNAVLVSVEAYYYQRFVDAIGTNRIILQEGILPKPIAARSEVQCIASDGNWNRLIVTTIDSAGSLKWTPRSAELAVAANEKIRFQMQYVAA